MKKLAFLAMVLLGVMLSCSLPTVQDVPATARPGTPTPSLSPAQQEALEQFREDAAEEPQLLIEGGIPRFVDPNMAATSDDPLSAALDYFRAYAGLYGLRDVDSELHLQRVMDTGIGTQVVFTQTIKDVPVYASQVIVLISADRQIL